MSKPTKTCRVCGKKYEACSPAFGVPTGNRWQDVACCIEHANEYFARVEAARSGSAVAETPVGEAEPVVEPSVDDAEDTVKSGDDVPVARDKKKRSAGSKNR